MHHSAKNWALRQTSDGLSLRGTMVIFGAAMLICGASPDLFRQSTSAFKTIKWKRVIAGIITAAECSRWFFTVVQATRDLQRRWP